ncbi:hypothetical protein Vafri_10676 [Volvox africanus]|uniref:RRM domain-containing protein n=1 Tax=Volvox africanus TaxID=51714 RepID=A0A8J4F0X4_9CHLO|nr:hypothetical protein Vafri_10676 [Volvox africanus]
MADHAEDDALTINGETIKHPNLYVRNLPPNMDQTAVEVMFRRFGTCTGCKFFKTAAVPYAFLRLGSPSEALAAIKAMNGTTVSGKIILVKPAETDAVYDLPNENLYVRNIPVSWNEEDIRQFFEKYGPLVSVRVLPPIPTSVGQVAMVRFQQLEHAQAARDGVNATTPSGEHLPLNVKFADHQDEKTRKQQSRLVKVGSGSIGPGGPGLHRYAPYPGASGGPGFPLPPPGAPMPLMMDSGDFMPFGPGGPGAPPPGAMMQPLDVMGDMGMSPPPWAGPGHPAMFGMLPPPPPPPPRSQQQHQQQMQPQLQPQAQQPPVLAVAVDTSSGQYMLTQPPGLGGPGAARPAQPQPGIIPVVPLQPSALQTGQLQPLAQTPAQQQQPRPALQPGAQSQQPPGAALTQQQQPGGPKPSSSGVPQQAPYAGQPTQPPAAQPPVAPPIAPSGAPQPYPGQDPQTAQHYAQQPYGAMPYGYPANPHDPYAQAQAQQQQTYDAQTAAYYAAYYGHSYGHPPSQPGAAGGQQPVPPTGQLSQHPGGAMPTDPYQAYYYYQQYCGSIPPQQQPQQQSQAQAPQQTYAAPGPVNNAASSSTAPVATATPTAYPTGAQTVSGQQTGATAGASALAATAAQPLPQQQQQPALPWNPQTAVQQQPQAQAQATSVGATAQKPQQQPAVAAASVPQQPITHLSGTSATASGTTTASGGPTTANGVAITANGNGTVPAGFKPSCRIMISNLPAEAEKINMYESFAPYGAVLAVHVTNGFGVVQYADRDSAVRAASAMNGGKVRGATVKVGLAEA